MPATAFDHGAATPLDGTWRGARWGVVAIGCALAGFGLAAAAVLAYNLAVRRFPSNIAARLFGFEKKDAYFEASPESQAVPKVEF